MFVDRRVDLLRAEGTWKCILGIKGFFGILLCYSSLFFPFFCWNNVVVAREQTFPLFPSNSRKIGFGGIKGSKFQKLI